MRTAIFVTFVFLAGCASSVEKVQSLRSQAPDWYEARKVEFRGEGYPDLNSIPDPTPRKRTLKRLRMSEADVNAALEVFYADPRAEGAVETPEEIRAWARETKRAVEGQLPAPDFMTDEEVEQIKARFNVSRARL